MQERGKKSNQKSRVLTERHRLFWTKLPKKWGICWMPNTCFDFFQSTPNLVSFKNMIFSVNLLKIAISVAHFRVQFRKKVNLPLPLYSSQIAFYWHIRKNLNHYICTWIFFLPSVAWVTFSSYTSCAVTIIWLIERTTL